MGAHMEKGGLFCPFEEVFRNEPLSEVEDEVGFERARGSDDVFIMEDLFLCRSASGIRKDVGENRPSEPLGEPQRGSGIGADVAEEDDAPRRGRADRVGGEPWEKKENRLSLGEGRRGAERFPERAVEMDRPLRVLKSVKNGLGGDGAVGLFLEVERQVELPIDGVVEDVDLVGGLIRAAMAELVRPVCC